MTKVDLIDFNQITKKFVTDDGVNHVLNGVDLSIPEGSIYGVIGYSGAGKSTLIRCINGLEHPTNGQISFNGNVINDLRPAQLLRMRNQIGMIFQQFNLMPNRTIAENVALPIKYKHFSKSKRIQKIKQLLNLVGLSDKFSDYPSSLSGGQKQRVSIARALINDPKVLLCDEITSALDPDTTESILKLLKRLNHKYGITIIMVTHEMKVIEQLCNQVAVLDHGKIIEHGKVYDVFANPHKTLTKQFFDTDSNVKLPANFIDKLQLDDNQEMLHLNYQNGESIRPLISYLTKKFSIDINILTGDMKIIQNQLLGNLVVIIEGDLGNLQSTRKYLSQQDGINVEVIKNVK